MDVKDLLIFAAHEAESRPLRHTPVEIIDYHPSRHDRHVLAPTGSVMVYVAQKGSRVISRIRDTVSSKSGGDIQLAEELHKQYEGRKLLSPFQAWRQLKSQAVFGDIRYGGRTIANNLFVPAGATAAWIASPYNGGHLSPRELTLVEHFREGSPAALEAIALRCQPSLTPAERAAVDAVPADQLELNLGPNGDCCGGVTDVVQIIIAIIVATSLCDPQGWSQDPVEHLSEEELKAMSPTATAIRLMEIRREALGHEHS
jgi:hypothetical protein